ncbi:MAG: hypothetical protein IJM21_10900 [Clostridia bacterium]|nr:hypothetical protein [Clostridia bacterium]
MLKKRLLQAYITLTFFFLGWQGIRYLANNVPEFDNVVIITVLLVVLVLVGAVAALAITRMIDDYDRKKEAEGAAAEAEKPQGKPGQKKKKK